MVVMMLPIFRLILLRIILRNTLMRIINSKLIFLLKQNPLGLHAAWLLVVAAFVSVGLFRLPLIWALSAIGLTGCWLAYRSLSKADALADTGSKPQSESDAT